VNYLLDTCFLSELIRPRPDEGVRDWLERTNNENLFLSVISLGELAKGVSKLSDGAKRQRLTEWLDGQLRPRFKDRLLNIDENTAMIWGEICGQTARQGKTLPVMDAWIAATALSHRLTIVTRNISDFECCGVLVLNPWGK
jgi:predicted nucleic acid-binding protein